MEKLSNYKVSNTTAKFVSTLATLNNAENDFLDALITLYGEETGDKFFHQSDSLFEGLRKQVAEYLAMSITLISEDGDNRENVI